jgi:hypothetical protein
MNSKTIISLFAITILELCSINVYSEVVFDHEKCSLDIPDVSKDLLEKIKNVYIELQNGKIDPLILSIEGDRNSVEYVNQIALAGDLKKILNSKNFCTLRHGTISSHYNESTHSEICVIVWNAISGFEEKANVHGLDIKTNNSSIYNQVHVWKKNTSSNKITLEIVDIGNLGK